MATLFIDYENGNDNYAGTSFDVLASGTNGRISGSIFSSATANFPNDGTLCNTKNLFSDAENNLSNNNYWAAVRTTRTLSNTTPPSVVSSSNVWNILETTDTNTHDIRTVSTVVNLTLGVNYTTSCYVKANGRNQIVIRHGASSAKGIRYDLNSGTIAASGASATGSISNEGNGWYRISLTTTPDSANDIIYIMPAQDSYTGTSSESYTGDLTKGFYIAAPQLEQSNSVTSYETPVSSQYLSIYNGTFYPTYIITAWISSTSLTITPISGGTALANQSVDRQYYIGGRWKTISSTGATAARLVPGDTIRIMGSPAPTPVGSGLWTGDRGGIVAAITSTTNTSPITVNCSLTMSALGISTGDTITIGGHTTNTNANGTWVVTVADPNLGQCTLNGSTGNGTGGAAGHLKKRTNCVVQLDSPVTANIASYGNRGEGRTAWTASTNVTATFDGTDTKEGDVSDSIAVGASFTTGKAAYKATGSLDLSSYQQLSFYIKQTAGTVAVANDISIRLCSDTAGNTVVNTFNIEGLVVLNSWIPITINLGSAMSSSIQSVALYVDIDRGAQTFLLSNIIACKSPDVDDSLNLQSLIGKNTTDEPWFPIMSINGTRVVLGNHAGVTPLSSSSSTSDTYRGYSGVTENTLVYKRETIKTNMATAATTQVFVIQETGTSTASFYYEFGWDRTNMSIQNLETYFDGRNSLGWGIYTVNTSFLNINKLGVVRYSTGGRFYINTSSTYSLEYAIGCSQNGWDMSTCKKNIYNYMYSCSNAYGIYNATNCGRNIVNKLICYSDMVAGLVITDSVSNTVYNNITIINTGRNGLDTRESNNNIFNTGIIKNCGSYGLQILIGGGQTFNSITTTNNGTASVNLNCGDVYLNNCVLNESSEFVLNTYMNYRAYLSNHDGTPNNTFIITDYGIIMPQTAVRYSNTGYAWAMSPTSTLRDSSYPLNFPIGKVAVNANSLVTIKAWMRRDNIGLTTGLRITGGQIAGVPNDITSYMSAAADTWEQVILTFTPTEIGVIEILAECYGGSTFTGYIDDISITQV